MIFFRRYVTYKRLIKDIYKFLTFLIEYINVFLNEKDNYKDYMNITFMKFQLF